MYDRPRDNSQDHIRWTLNVEWMLFNCLARRCWIRHPLHLSSVFIPYLWTGWWWWWSRSISWNVFIFASVGTLHFLYYYYLFSSMDGWVEWSAKDCPFHRGILCRHVSCMFTRVWCNTEITTTIPDLERDCTWARKNTRELHRIATIVVMEDNGGNIKGRKRLD